MEYIIENWDSITTIIITAVLLADKIAKLTPTNKDDDIIDFIKRKFPLTITKPKDKK